VVSVGSAKGNALVLTDERVSGRHFEVETTGNGFVVRDLSSTNGTRLMGTRIKQAEAPPGATLQVGKSFLRIQPQATALTVPPSQARRFGGLVAEGLAMREVFALLELAAASSVTVLVTGETGTGKELVARALHDTGPRKAGPFVAVDCGALPEALLESELFGHVRGAFTGAERDRKGAFARAHGGTLFLDELATVPPAAQARLLRVLEERRVQPVGADEAKAIDVRVVAATTVDLGTAVAAGKFRPDLYYRLSVLGVHLPPLRDRLEDLPAIVSALLGSRGFEDIRVEGPGLAALRAHRWPGNVRELRNVIERALALSPQARSFAELKPVIPDAVAAVGAMSVRTELPFKEAKGVVNTAFEARYVADLHARHQGNLSAAAREAGVDRKHWRELLKKHGLREEN
jgi:DNA-binding NtrC family response regulator